MASFYPSTLTKGLDINAFAQNYAKQLIPKSTGFYPRPKPLTPSQEELLPYLQKEAERKARKKGLLQPVEALFNLLNRGQFLTAGIAQRIAKNLEQDRPVMEGMPETIKKAVTGKVQYDWEVVLFGGKHKGGEEYAGLMPWEPTTGAGKFGKGAAGFIANVLLDPLTYVGFGPARGARIAATKYSKDAVKFFMKGISKEAKEAIPEMIQKGFSKEVFTKKWGKSVPDALKYMEKYAGGDITKFYSKIQKQAYKEALRKTSKELTEPLLKGFEKELAEKGIAKGAKRLSKKRIKALAGEEDYLKKQIEYLTQAVSPYAGAGTRAGRFMRTEFGVGERYPDWLKTMDKLRKRMGESKIGGRFSDAWWGVMNNPKSPVAGLRRMFHVRNPYQKLVSIMEKDLVAQSSYSMVAKGNRIGKIVDDLTKEEYVAVRDFMIKSQIMQEQAQRGAETVPIRAAELVQKYGKDIDVTKVSKRIDELNRLTKEWWDFDQLAFKKGLVPETGMWRDYLPEQRIGAGKKSATQMGAAAQTFTKERKAGWSGNIESQVQKIKWMYGMDEESAYKVLMGGGGELNVDLKDMLIRRALAQTRLEQRVNMIESFREFGINLDEIKNMPGGQDIYRELAGKWGQLKQLGLKPVDGKGLEGFVFDIEIADVLQRAMDLGKDDKSMKAWVNALSSFTSWWRGWATLSPGFHARNFFSNNLTGFLKHGMAWFNPNTHLEAFVGTTIGLNGLEGGIKKLSKIMPEGMVKEIAARRIGNNTIAELAESAAGGGVITRMSRGYGQPGTFEGMVKQQGKLFDNLNVNPFSTQFSGMKGSQALGSYIESTAKFQSYLMDLRVGVKQGANMQSAMDFAKMEAKKWWIDYSDLSEFEQKVMKNVIPFYCVPDDTEILTKDGWRFRKDLSIGMKVLTFNIPAGCSEWQIVDDIAVFDFDDKLIHATGQYADFRYTRDHRFPVKVRRKKVKGKWYGGETKIIRAYEFNSHHNLFASIPHRRMEEEDVSSLTSREAAIVGWIVTDGYQRWRGNHLEQMIYQHPKKHAQEIRELLGSFCTSEGIHPETGVICFRVGVAFGHKIEKKDLPMLVTRLSNDALVAMYEAMVKAEGSNCKGNIQFGQNPGPVMDAFQIICQLLNKPFGFSIKMGSNARYGYVRNTTMIQTKYLKIKEEHYIGKIWCPKTANSTWLMRQNGKLIWSGNTWIRGNIANQFAGLMQYPEMYSLLPKATQALTAEGGPEREELPEWMRELGMFPIGQEDGKTRMFWPNFPYQDINKLPVKFEMSEAGVPIPRFADISSTISEIAADAHPLIKSIIQSIPKEGVDIFYREPLGETRKAPRMLRLLTKPIMTKRAKIMGKPESMLGFLDGLIRRVGFEEGLRLDINKKGQLIMDAKMAKTLEDNILPLRMLAQYFDLPELLFPAIEDWKRKVTGAVDDYEAVEQFLQTLSFYAGVKMKDIELEDYQFRQKEELLEKAQAARRKAMRKMPGAEARSQAWKQNRIQYQKRLGL